LQDNDFCLACCLRCSGYELTGMHRNGRRCVFAHQDRSTRPDDVRAFYSDRVTTPPLRSVGAIRTMKALLHHG
jgi:hypothetical protein